MADTTLESLEIEVKHKASGTADELDKVTESVRKLSRALKKCIPNLSTFNSLLGDRSFTYNDNHVTQIADSITNVKEAAKKAGSATTEASKGVREVSKEAKKASKPVNAFGKSLGRIAFYRAIRTIIKNIGAAFQEGLSNAYAFSQGIASEGHRFSAALDAMSSAGLKMKNQLGSAFIALLAAIQPVVNAIIALIVRLADAMSQLFAAFTGGTYLKAKDVFKSWEDTAKSGAKAAKEWRNQLMGFDEINRLEEPTSGSKGNAGTELDPADMFEDVEISGWAKRLQELLQDLAAGIRLNINDVLFNWSDLNPEQIVKKAVVGLCAILGAVTGFIFGGVPGALFGAFAGVSLGLLIDTVTFNNDGKISASEVADMLRMALFALVGGAIGFSVGGPGGALLGAAIGIGVYALLKTMSFKSAKMSNFLNQLTIALAALAGAAIGFTVGGPAGALIGAIVGIGVTGVISSLTFKNKSDEERAKYKNGLSWFVVGVLGLPSDEELLGWGKSVASWIGEGLADFGKEILLALGIDDAVGVIKAYFQEKMESVGGNVIKGLLVGTKDAIVGIGSWFKIHVVDPVVNAFKTLFGIQSSSETSTGSTVFDEIGGNVIDGFLSGILGGLSGIFDWVKEKIYNPFVGAIKTWFGISENDATETNSVGKKIVEGLKNGVTNAWQSFLTLLDQKWDALKQWWQGLTLPQFKLKLPTISINGEFSLKPLRVPWFSLSWGEYAQGGFPDEGELFLAREAGPELVGQMGGHTAVASNTQIIEGIRAGVFEAMTAVMSNSNSGNGSREVVLNINGREFMRATYSDLKAVQRERGVSLVANA